MIAAMRAKDKPRKNAISVLTSAVKKAGIDAGCRDDIPTTMVDQVILKELKSVQEGIRESAGRAKLHRLLGVLFSQRMNVEEKSRILKEEYKISMEEGFGKDVEAMCNLGQGIKEAGIREGIELGRREERKYTEREKRRADELERKNAWLTELLAAHGIQV